MQQLLLRYVCIIALALSIGVECLQLVPFAKCKHTINRLQIWGKYQTAIIATRKYGTVDMFDNFNQNQWYQYAVISASAALSLKSERFKIGQLLSAPVCSMLISVILTNINVLPAEGSGYIRRLVDISVKLATPLLLLDADFKRIYKETGGSLVFAFLLGTIGTLVGSTVAYRLLGLNIMNIPLLGSGDGWKLASALTAKNIGGGINYMGVANELVLSPVGISVGLTVDNLLGLMYFPLMSYLSSLVNITDIKRRVDPSDNQAVESSDKLKEIYSINNLIASLTLCFFITASSEIFGPFLKMAPISLSTIITVVCASLFPDKLKNLIPVSDLLGKTLLTLFFASIGNLSGLILPLLKQSISLWPLFAFNAVLYLVHLFIVFVIGLKVFKFPLYELVIASNANIGNAATASSLAVGRGWKSLVVPALLVGTLGNSIGTIAAVSLGKSYFSHLF